MADNEIKTRFTLDGESEYRSALKGINSDAKELKSEMSLLQSQYSDQQNSIDFLTQKGEILSRMYADQSDKVSQTAKMLESAKTAQSDYADKISDTKSKLEEAQKSLDALNQDETASAEAKQALQTQIDALNGQLENQQNAYDKASGKVTQYQTTLNYAQSDLNKLDGEVQTNAGLMDEARGSVDGCAASIDGYGKSVGDAEKGTSMLNDLLAAGFIQDGLDKIADTAQQAAQWLLELGDASQQATATIAEGTGATGANLDALKASYWNVVQSVDQTDLSAISSTIADVNTMFGATGDQLESLSTDITYFAKITGTSASTEVKNLSDVMKNWNISTDDATSLMDKLTSASQMSGASVDTLSGYLVANKAQLQQMGYSLDESIGYLSNLEYQGMNTSSIMMGLKTAIKNISDDGGDVVSGLQSITQSIQNAGTESEATAIAVDAFGSKAGQELAYAIRSGRYDIEDWTAAIENSGGAVESTAKAAETSKDKFNKALNQMKAGVSDYADSLYDLGEDAIPAVEAALKWMIEHADGVASGIVGITTAVVSFKVATAAATIATEAFGIALNASGIGLAAAAVGGLVAAVGAYAATTYDAKVGADQLTTTSAGLSNNVKTTVSDLDAEKTSIDENNASVMEMVSQLETLTGKEAATAAEKEQIAALVAQLNASVPNLSLSYDDLSGSLSLTTDEIIRMAKAQANADQYAADQAALNDLLGQQADVQERLAETNDALSDAQKAYDDALQDYNDHLGDAPGVVTEYGDALQNAKSDLYDAQDAQKDAQDASDDLSGAIDDLSSEMADLSGAAEDATDATSDLTDEQERNQQIAEQQAAVDEQYQASYDALKQELSDLVDEYNAAYDAAYNSITGTCGLFEQVTEASSISTDEMMANMQQQAEWMNGYTANIQALKDAGLSQALIAELSDGSTQSAAYAAELVSQLDTISAGQDDVYGDTQTFVDDFNGKYAETRTAADQFSGTVAEMQTDFSAGAADITSRLGTMVASFNQSDKTRAYGVNIIQGYINGINSKSSALYGTMQSIISTALQKARDTAEEASPSKATARDGVYLMQGYQQGILSEAKNTEQLLADTIDNVLKSGAGTVNAYYDNFPTEMTTHNYYSSNSTVVNNPSRSAQPVTINLVQNGKIIDSKFISDLDRANGAEVKLKDRNLS